MYENLRRRLIALACVPLVAPAWVVIPETLVAAPRAHPVQASVKSLALTGIDESAAESMGLEVAGQSNSDVQRGTKSQAGAAAKLVDVALTKKVDTEEFSLLGVSWNGDQAPQALVASVRTKTDGAWSEWVAIPSDDDHAPDPGSAEASGSARGGTDPLFVAASTGVQVRVQTGDGRHPKGLRVDLINPGDSDADASAGQASVSQAQAAGAKPTILTRKDWGADETLKTGGATFGEINGSFIHHTAGANTYTQDQVPGIIRGIYAYHVKSRGWKDIGYNFLVDKYGRVWEGRYGGVDKPVIGAHTSGFNDDAFAMSTLGTLTTVAPTQATLDAYARLYAWKLGIHHVDPATNVNLDGTTLRAVSGHRDAGQTACPGDKLYAKIPAVATATRTIMGASLFGPTRSTSGWSYGATTGVTLKAKVAMNQTYRVDVSMACLAAPVRSLTGSVTAATGLSVNWDGRLSNGKLAPPGTYNVLVSTSSADGTTSDSWTTSVKVAATASSPAALCTGTAVPTATSNATASTTPKPTATPTQTPTPTLASTAHVQPVTIDQAFAVDSDKVFALKGHGWGHGRSMSQYGANGAASQGLGYKDILKFYYPGTTLGAVGNPKMRVLLSTDTGYDVWVRAESGLAAKYYPQGSATAVTTPVPATLAGSTVSSWRFRAVDMGTYFDVVIEGYAGGAWRTWKTDTQVVGSKALEWVPSDSGLYVTNRSTGERRAYRGTLRAIRSSGSFQAINVVSLDSYLRSVVPNEMPASWRTEALKAQSVTARTFALAEAARRAGGTYDVFDDTRSQEYRGQARYNASWVLLSSYEHDRSTAAITATTGTGILSGGLPIRAQFASTNGGGTLGDTGGVTWERSYADPYEKFAAPPRGTWTDSISAATLQARYPSLGTLVRIRVTQRSGVGDWKGRIMVVRLEGSKATVTLRGDSAVRSAFGTYSSWFTVVP